ncbi:hypothetical protein MMC29_002795 [Sticta canariensis]|nr:hypothetical protein [Sticta canariensis]
MPTVTPSKRVLAEADPNPEAAPSTNKERSQNPKMARDSSSSAEPVKKASAKASTSKLSSDITSASPEATWICICRPASDRAAELGIDSEDDKADTLEEFCGGDPKCLCRKPADEHPERK